MNCIPTWRLAILATILTAEALTSPARCAAEPFTVMTWNLEWFYDDAKKDNYSDLAIEKASPSRGQWNWRRDAAATAIAKIAPSVAAVQEIEGQRVLWYLTRSLERDHKLKYDEFVIQGNDHFTEQDVGLLVRSPVDLFSVMRGNVTSRMNRDTFGSVSKHVAAFIEVPIGQTTKDQTTETILIVNVHLRSRDVGDPIRKKQAASLNEWINGWTRHAPTTPVIVLGDFNTEQVAENVDPRSELAILMSRSTVDPSDDLIDLHDRIPKSGRQTHLLKGKQFDRILVSRSLVEDTPNVPDLVLSNVKVRRDVVIRGRGDTPTEHWDDYWGQPDDQRDLSDHYPVVAEFEIR
ncbi:endonuclease/exonuclease/phosphatase family protein [Neorhodopirellula lusitana]|uniref:endonuclease/exonuclease/phosphatase family protein n=1 Tax=Neorhodopirellula lusitana TaxID=445327 RepID=UPI0024B72B9C|nr:endonuclease/exonuclease/phosphatase family protein [Neorhodopirellula lusitana]